MPSGDTVGRASPPEQLKSVRQHVARVCERARSGLGGVVRRFRAGATEQGWGWLVAALTLVGAGWVYARTPATHVPASDGFYSYLYARSLAFDGDIDFANDYALCGDPFGIGMDRGTGRPDNIFYPGPALFWVPILALLRLFVSAERLQDGCSGLSTTCALALGPVAGALVSYLSYRVARRWFSDEVAALSAALLSLGGLVFRFSALLPSYSHVYDALCVAGLLVATLRLQERPDRRWRWLLVTVLLAACVLQRASNLAFAVVPLAAGLVALRSARWPRRLAIAAAVPGVGVLGALGVLASISHYLYGDPFVFSHGRHFLHPGHAHPWLLLFDLEEGLFFFTPTVWLAVAGLVAALRAREVRVLLLPLLGVAGFEWWLSASALDWAPARRLTNLTPLWVLLACFPLRWLGERLRLAARGAAAVGALAAAPFVIYQLGYAWGVHRGLVPTERPLSQSELYGASVASFWSMLDESVGTLAILPLEHAFAARYGLPADRFGEAVFARWYVRDFRTLRWRERDLPFTDGALRRLTVGFEPVRRGARPFDVAPRLVFSAQWPYATQATLRAVSTTSGTVRLGQGRILREPLWFGPAQPLRAGTQAYEFTIPEGGFSSGVNELVFEFDVQSLPDVVVIGVRLDDLSDRPPAL